MNKNPQKSSFSCICYSWKIQLKKKGGKTNLFFLPKGANEKIILQASSPKSFPLWL